MSLWSHKPRERWQQCPEEPLFVSGTEADNCVSANRKMFFFQRYFKDLKVLKTVFWLQKDEKKKKSIEGTRKTSI